MTARDLRDRAEALHRELRGFQVTTAIAANHPHVTAIERALAAVRAETIEQAIKACNDWQATARIAADAEWIVRGIADRIRALAGEPVKP
jgi:hypothetical protein